MANVAHPASHRSWSLGGTLPRQRGAVNGLLLVVLGAWGALVPFIGPLINVAYTPNNTWTYTTGRLLLDILPGAAAILAGLGLLGVTTRFSGVFWGWVGALAGAWFLVGPSLSRIWTHGTGDTGVPTAATATGRAVQEILFFYGIGAAIVFLAAVALGRFTVGHR